MGVSIAFVLGFVAGAVLSYLSDKKNWLD